MGTVKFAWLALMMVAFLSGCASFRTLDHNSSLAEGEVVFVMGVAPENFRVKIFPGEVKNGVFHENNLRLSAFYGAAENGYVVGKAQVDDVLAITMVRKVENSSDIRGKDFAPCQDYKTMVFRVPNQRVVYLGDIHYEIKGKQLHIQYSDNLDAATAYLASTYPNIKYVPERISYELLPAALSCTRSIYVPQFIFIPR